MRFLLALFLFAQIAAASEFEIYVSNERSDNVTVINGVTNEIINTISVGKRPRGIHASPDGKHVYVALTGSPRVGPGVDRDRTVADKSADGIGVIDTASRKLLSKYSVGSDPEQFA